MNIQEHRLRSDNGSPIAFRESPNVGGALDPSYLVVHFTAGANAESSVKWLTNKTARASAHVVIARDGTVTQLVPFDRVAWHAGASRWNGLTGLNRHSIGIELDNAGRLTRQGGRWRAWFGGNVPDDEVMEATHKNETEACGWHLYTPEQVEATLEVSRGILGAYPRIRDVLGHDDISPGRKTDPGPAFPLGSLRGHLFGRAEDRAPAFETITALNIRRGPGTQHESLPVSPLPNGTRLDVLREQGSWRFVDVVGTVGGEGDIQGWVHGRYVKPVD
ncbi:MAG: N-acetylmuramoyl-L-alanine amidase [Gemmatimonadales bacterium]|nr:MAG: N-acetylmuramoyl-L-alanine amidase [Gemmatimonadales bacterium]